MLGEEDGRHIGHTQVMPGVAQFAFCTASIDNTPVAFAMSRVLTAVFISAIRPEPLSPRPEDTFPAGAG